MDLTNVRLVQVWQYAAQSERTLDQVIATARRFGYTGILIKAIDGLTWMGNVSAEQPHADALRTIAQAKEARIKVNAAGLQYCLWTVPQWDEDRLRQAQLTAELTGACDALFLDVEPYDHFWGANRPSGDAAGFMQVIRAIAPTATIVLQPDPRTGRLQDIRADEWLPHCDGLAGQHYWNTFETNDPAAQMALALEEAHRFGVAPVPTLPLASTPELLQTAIDALQSAGVLAWCTWRLGVGDNATLAVVGRAAPGGGEGTTPNNRGIIADVLGGWSQKIRSGALSAPDAAQAVFEVRSAADAIQRGEAG